MLEMARNTRPLYEKRGGEKGIMDFLMKAVSPGAESKQGVAPGRQGQPFHFTNVINFKNGNIHHSTCIEAKVASTVGLGFTDGKSQPKAVAPGEPEPEKPDPDKPSKVDKALNPFCEISFLDVMTDVCEDFWQTGNGYMEVAREKPEGRILGLYHVPAPTVFVNIEGDTHNRHYEVAADAGFSTTRRFAAFGDGKGFLERAGGGEGDITDFKVPEDGRVPEIIHFRRSTSLSRWYGFPDWLSAVPNVELVQCLTQQSFDFFLNRGVPEFFLFLLGKQLSDGDWTKVQNAMKANIGLGNAFKSIALNIQDPDMVVQLEKLGLEGKSDGGQFSSMSDTLAMQIVSAHRVPPLLAGIQIPGKLGATNELPNALMAFQTLVVGQAQKTFMTILGNTLGNKEVNGKLGLVPEDFKFNKITDIIDLGNMDTVSRMRETVPEAKAKGRDLQEGVKKSFENMSEEEAGKLMGRVFSLLLEKMLEAA
jgi:capsid portal protein